MPLVTANQFNLHPDAAGAIDQGVSSGQKLRSQFQLGKQQEKAAATEEEKNRYISVVNGASKLSTLPNDEAKVSALDKREADLIAKGLPTQDTVELRNLFISGRGEEANALIESTVKDGVLRGVLTAPTAAKGFTLGQGQTRFNAEGNVIAEGGEKPPALTSLQKNAAALGLAPGSPEYNDFITKGATQSLVKIGAQDNAFSKALGAKNAATFGKVNEQRDSAIEANQSLDVLENIDVASGKLEPFIQGLAAWGKAFGVDTSGLANVSAGEAFNAEAQRIVLSVKASQKGPQTDKDEATIRKTVANLGNTQEGNQFIMNSARALNNRRIERADFYDNFIQENGGKFRDENRQTADAAWAKFKRETPMVSANRRTPEGLPVFFYKFNQEVRQANPDASKAEILQAWRDSDKKRVK